MVPRNPSIGIRSHAPNNTWTRGLRTNILGNHKNPLSYLSACFFAMSALLGRVSPPDNVQPTARWISSNCARFFSTLCSQTDGTRPPCNRNARRFSTNVCRLDFGPSCSQLWRSAISASNSQRTSAPPSTSQSREHLFMHVFFVLSMFGLIVCFQHPSIYRSAVCFSMSTMNDEG